MVDEAQKYAGPLAEMSVGTPLTSARDKSPLEAALDEADRELATLLDLAQNVVARFGPVLGHGVELGTELAEPMPPRSEVVTRVESISMSVRTTQAVLREVLHRCEV